MTKQKKQVKKVKFPKNFGKMKEEEELEKIKSWKGWAIIDAIHIYEVILSKGDIEDIKKNSAKYLIMKKQGLEIIPVTIINDNLW